MYFEQLGGALKACGALLPGGVSVGTCTRLAETSLVRQSVRRSNDRVVS
jgi:hypothetical protein